MNVSSDSDQNELYQRGLSYYQAGEYARGCDAVDQLLRSDPQHVLGLTLKGMILSELDRPEEAVAVLRQAVQIDPSQGEAWSQLGVALMIAGQLGQSAEAFRSAVRVRPDDVHALIDGANVLFMAGHVEEALGMLQEARRLRPDDRSIARNLADMLLAAQKLDLALEAVRGILELSREDLVAWSDMAWLSYRLDRLGEASESFQTLKELAPEAEHSLYALHGLVMTEIRRKNWRQALEWAIEATRLDRYEFTTLLLQFISSRVFDREAEVDEEELFDRFEAEHHEHRRLCAEVPAAIP